MTEKSTLSAGKYVIDLDKGATHVYTVDEDGARTWVCATTDPKQAMEIVEGLVMVETKRFYYPQSSPDVSSSTASPVPPFLKRANETR